MDNQVLKDIALARGKSVVQICIRRLYQQGVTFVPKSYNKERLKHNREIFDWDLAEDDLHKISLISQQKLILGASYVSDPKYLEELWDAEL